MNPRLKMSHEGEYLCVAGLLAGWYVCLSVVGVLNRWSVCVCVGGLCVLDGWSVCVCVGVEAECCWVQVSHGVSVQTSMAMRCRTAAFLHVCTHDCHLLSVCRAVEKPIFSSV